MKTSNDSLPAFIFTRCVNGENNHNNEFQQVVEFFGKTHVHQKRIGRNLFGNFCFDTSNKITWMDGYSLCKQAGSFFNELMTTYLNAPLNNGLLGSQLKELLETVASETRIRLGHEIILLVHRGNKTLSGDDFVILQDVLSKSLATAGIKITFRLITSVESGYQNENTGDFSTPILNNGYFLPAEGNDIQTIRSRLDRIRPADMTAAPAFLGFDFSLKPLLLADSLEAIDILFKEASGEVKALIPPVSFFQAAITEIGGLPLATSKSYRIYAAEVEGSKSIVVKTSVSPSAILYRLIQHLFEPRFADDIIFIYLGLDVLVRDYYKCSYEFENLSKERKPFVFITSFDFYDIAGMGAEAVTRGQLGSALTDIIDGRFRFFDSSVWFRCLSLFARAEKLESLKADLHKNITCGIYQVKQAWESRDYMIRVFNQAYIEIIEENSHGKYVTPTLFHSEYFLKQKLKSLLERQAEILRKIQWSIYIIDDHVATSLETFQRDGAGVPGQAFEQTKTKKNLINYLLHEFINQDETIPGQSLHFDKIIKIEMCASTVREGITMLQKDSTANQSIKHPDVILLDFLLFDQKQQEYGDEVIRFVADKAPKETIKTGPSGKTWFFPISVYTNAIQNRLHEAGISMVAGDRIIHPGADPITTPYLFLYDLLSLLVSQVSDIIAEPVNEDGTAQFGNPVFEHIGALITSDNPRKTAMQLFPGLVRLAVSYAYIRVNRHFSSFFDSVCNTYFDNLEIFEVEQFRDFVYLLAFGGASDRNRWWGEWIVTKNLISKTPALYSKLSDKLPAFETKIYLT